jgi:probable rRNA maturation factor
MIKAHIEVSSKLWLKKIKKPSKSINKILNKINKILKFSPKKYYTFTILLANNSKIKSLNKKFRKKNKATDVLSFPFYKKKNFLKTNKRDVYLGDVIISFEFVFKRSMDKIFLNEFNKVWIHGFLHLLGHDHIKNKDYKKMQYLENKILKLT